MNFARALYEVCITRALDLDRRCPCCRTAVSLGALQNASQKMPDSERSVSEG